ncbi:MAG TPA: hypothetical protein VI306_10375 [Pyrinomonadaceae bacterium]
MDKLIAQNAISTSLVKESPESESSFWEVPEPPDKQLTVQEPEAPQARVDGEFYKRVGFYSAFHKSSHQKFQQVLQELHATAKQTLDHLKKELDSDVARFNNGKQDADGKISDIKTALLLYEQEVENLRDESVVLESRLQKLREDIKETLIRIGSKKETLIADRQTALLEELKRLNSELEEVVRKRMNLNEEIFDKQKEVLKEKRDFLTKLFKKYEDEHTQVVEKLRLYSIPGFNSLSSAFLYHAGLISATVAGGFFGSFAQANFLASGGAFSFLIQALFTFSTTFIGQSANAPSFKTKLSYAGILLGIFFGLFILMFLVSWLCHFAYQKLVLKPNESSAKPKTNAKGEDPNAVIFTFNFEGNDDLPVTAKVAEKSFFLFWIRVLPFVLFLSIVFILISLGTDVSAMRSLDASVAGYTIGFLIALASAGISYVYLTMFLERRIEQQVAKGQKQEIQWARLNIELLIIIVVFIAVVTGTLVGFHYPFKSDGHTLSIVSFTFFVAGCLITAFTLGFGIRLQSLEAARQQLEVECDITQTKLIRISRPLQIHLTGTENDHFNQKFISIRDEVMNLMLERTTLTRNAISTPVVKPREKSRFLSNLKFFSDIHRWFQKRLPWGTRDAQVNTSPEKDKNSPDELDTLSASEDVKLCFPQLEAELTALESEAAEVRSRMRSVENEITFRTEHKGEFYERKTADLKHQENRSRNYHVAITNREKKFHQAAAEERQRESFLTQKIVEGYELGDWFTKHGLAKTEIPDSVWNGNGKS